MFKMRLLLCITVPFVLAGCNDEVPTSDQVKQAFITSGYGKEIVSQIKVEKCQAGAKSEATCDITLDSRTVARRFIKNDNGDWLVSS